MPHARGQRGADSIWYGSGDVMRCIVTLQYCGCKASGDSTQLTATPKLVGAYVASEAMRRDLVEARQKLMAAKEKEEDPAKKMKIDEDAPGN